MKTSEKRWLGGLSVGLWVLSGPWLFAGVDVGDSYDAVIDRLGAPTVYIQTDTMAWLHYDRGTVKLEEGRVVEASLISPAKAEARHALEREELERRRTLLAEQEARRIQEGWDLKQSRSVDPRFHASPASQQVAFWRSFMVRYPEIPVHGELAIAMEQYQAERERALQERERERRITELEERLRRAEEREMARSYSGARRSVYHRGPQVVLVAGHHHPYPLHRAHPVTIIHGTPVHKGVRTRPISGSYADRVFGPMPVMSSPGYSPVRRPASGFSASIRGSF